MRFKTVFTVLVLCAFAFVSSVNALPLLFDQNITPDVIFGSGNANGSWTVDRSNGVELGLRAKLRFDSTNQPQNIFNSNGDGTYSFLIGQPPGGGFGFAPNSPSTAVWNFEWSINSNFDNLSGFDLDDLTYLLEIDFDPSAGTNFGSGDLINLPASAVPNFADHSIGDNTTVNGAGTEAGNRPDYLDLIANNNVAQNSWNMEFFDNTAAGFPFNANVAGTYTFQLTAFNGGSQIAQTHINVSAVPEPSTYLLFGVGILGIIGISYRQRKKAAGSNYDNK